MELYSDEFLPHIIELENKIETNSRKTTLTKDVLCQTKQRLFAVISRLDNLCNTKITINNAHPDLLYQIFKLAVYDSPRPEKTALKVSGVCRHWRKSALGWPALWAFVNLSSPHWILDLFMSRSGNAPLTVTLSMPQAKALNLETLPAQSYLESHIFPRLSSLDLYLPRDDIAKFQELSHTIPPLRLKSLMVCTEDYNPQGEPESIEFIPMDVSCLQELRLGRINLPYPEVLRDKLTHLVLSYWDQRPALSRFLVFLSNCPVLRDLRLDVLNWSRTIATVTDTTSTTPTDLSTVNLPKLKHLAFSAKGKISNDYVRTCLAFIRFTGQLSQLELKFIGKRSRQYRRELVTYTILESVPFEIWSHFSNHPYLMLDLCDYKYIIISALTGSSNNYGNRPKSDALYLSGHGELYSSLNRSNILEFTHVMSKITHLELTTATLHKFDLFEIDIQNEFPCLDILISHYRSTESGTGQIETQGAPITQSDI